MASDVKSSDAQKLEEARESLKQVLVQEVIGALKKNQIEAFYAPNREEAFKMVMDRIPPGSKVGYGGSLTLEELGIKSALKQGNYRFVDRERPGVSPEELFELRRQCLLSDVFLSSANAITRDGKLVNIDAFGNRVAALAFGPSKVIVVAGVNKVVDDLDRALDRIRNYVTPLHTRRRGWKVPCAQTGSCADCRSPERICGFVSVMEFQRDKGRVTVILVGEPLGL